MRRSMLKMSYAWAALSIASSPAWADNWPAWRGAGGSGICRETNLPLRWSTNENVHWRVALPDRGNSTPIVWRTAFHHSGHRAPAHHHLPESTHWGVALASRPNLDGGGTDASG